MWLHVVVGLFHACCMVRWYASMLREIGWWGLAFDWGSEVLMVLVDTQHVVGKMFCNIYVAT